LRTAEELEKKTTDFLQNILCKNSLDCIEKSLDHQASLRITLRGTSAQKQQAVKRLLS